MEQGIKYWTLTCDPPKIKLGFDHMATVYHATLYYSCLYELLASTSGILLVCKSPSYKMI